MIRSMTAYSRASKDSSLGRWVVEIHSVNRKFLDINLSLPKELLFLDIEIRKWVAEVLQRGQITVRIFLQQEGGGAASLSTLKKLKESWEKTAKDLGFDAKEITLSFLLEQMPSFSSDAAKDQEALRSSLKEVILQALKELLLMKEKEAVSLVQDMLKRVGIIEECKEKVVKDSSSVVDHYRKKLQDRLSEVLGPTVEGEERILREVVLFAEKIDLTEEITRLNSHIEQFRSVLSSKEKSVGRTLDFLVQEMNREINTLSAKCVGVELSLLMVTMKSELEKIREQLQNIE